MSLHEFRAGAARSIQTNSGNDVLQSMASDMERLIQKAKAANQLPMLAYLLEMALGEASRQMASHVSAQGRMAASPATVPTRATSKDWSETDLEDLMFSIRWHEKQGDDWPKAIRETAAFLCRDQQEVREKLRKLGIEERTDA